MSDSFSVRRIVMNHEDGTKFYRMLVVFSQETKFAVLIKRWGKKSLLGKFNIEKYSSATTAVAAMQEWRRVKSKRGYDAELLSGRDTDSYSGFAIHQMLFDEGVSRHVGLDLLNFMGDGTSSSKEEVEIVFEGSVDRPVINRDGDKEWASW